MHDSGPEHDGIAWELSPLETDKSIIVEVSPNASCQIEDPSTLLCAPQLRISPRSLERSAVNRWRQICSCSGVNLVQSVISSTMRSGSLLR